MSKPETGVGLNGEPDDFAARYDRMVVGSATGWVVRTLLVLVAALAAVALVSALLGG